MIEQQRCTICKVSYEVSWDDEPDIYFASVEDSDEDRSDYDEVPEPEYCPFCGKHVFDDAADELEK